MHPTYVGPMRIIELYDIGALLKDPRTGDIMSVHYQNIRKLALDELILLLLPNFDSEILKTLQLYRYNQSRVPDTTERYQVPANNADNNRTLRSGKVININFISLPCKYSEIAIQAQWQRWAKFRASDNDTDTDLPTVSTDLFNVFQYLKNRLKIY